MARTNEEFFRMLDTINSVARSIQAEMLTKLKFNVTGCRCIECDKPGCASRRLSYVKDWHWQ